MKKSQRLEYGRVAEVLAERGVVEPAILQEALQASEQGMGRFPEILINANRVSDWELSAVVCELYHLPFVTVDVAVPDPEALEGIDPMFLREHGIVPIGRFRGILTVGMPAIVPAEVLKQLADMTELHVLPVVGTVRTNRRWLDEHLDAETPSEDGSWSCPLFDEADEQVMLELEVPEDEPGAEELAPAPLPVVDLDAETSAPPPMSLDEDDDEELDLPPPLPPIPSQGAPVDEKKAEA